MNHEPERGNTQTPPSSPGRITARKDGGIGWLIFDNPAQRNAITFDMWRQAGEVLDDFERDDLIRVAILTGAGDKSFAAGADISEFSGTMSRGEQARASFAATDIGRKRFSSFKKPLIAMIQGYCIGAGLAIATRADIRIAADNASFAIPAARLGLGYIYETTRLLYGLVGPAHAKDILLSGRRFTSADALRMGLVNQVVPVAELEAATRAYAAQLEANAPLSMQSSKFTLNELQKDPADRDLASIEALCWACYDSADFIEGRQAFLEKRRAHFSGR